MRYDIQIAKVKDENSNLLGYADVTLGGSFAIRGIKIMNGSNGPFVSMPNYKSNRTDEDGKAVYKDICHAATGDFRQELVSNILSAYSGKHSPEISKITCTCLEDKGNLKAIADVVFNNSFVVKGVKVMEGSDGAFVSMPNYKVSRMVMMNFVMCVILLQKIFTNNSLIKFLKVMKQQSPVKIQGHSK